MSPLINKSEINGGSTQDTFNNPIHNNINKNMRNNNEHIIMLIKSPPTQESYMSLSDNDHLVLDKKQIHFLCGSDCNIF